MQPAIAIAAPRLQPLEPQDAAQVARYASVTGLNFKEALQGVLRIGLDSVAGVVDARDDSLADIRDETRVIRAVLQQLGPAIFGATKVLMHWRSRLGDLSEEHLEQVFPSAAEAEWQRALAEAGLDLSTLQLPPDYRTANAALQELLRLLHIIGPACIGTTRFVSISFGGPELGVDGETLDYHIRLAAQDEWREALSNAEIPDAAMPHDPQPEQGDDVVFEQRQEDRP